MKRKLGMAAGAVVVALGIAYVGASWWLGGRIEAEYAQRLAALQTQLGAGWTVEDAAYHRGVFHSDAEVLISIPAEVVGDAAADDQPVLIRVRDEIAHGPLADGTLAWGVSHARVQEVTGVDPDLLRVLKLDGAASARTVYRLNGAAHSDLHLPGGTLDWAGLPLQWSAANLRLEVHAGSQTELHAVLRWPGARGQVRIGDDSDAASAEQSAALKIEDVHATLDVTDRADSWLLAPGALQAQIGALTLTAPTAETGDVPASQPPQGAGKDAGAGAAAGTTTLIDLKDVALTSKSALVNGMLQGDTTWTTSGTVGGEPLQEFKYTERWSKVDAAAARSLLQLSRSEAAAGGAVDGRAVSSALQRLTDAGPQVTAQVEARLAGAPGSARLEVAVAPADAPSAGLAARLPWALQLLSRVTLDAALDLPQVWTPALARVAGLPDAADAELADALNDFVRMQLLTRDATGWHLRAGYADGRLTMNGAPAMNNLLGLIAQLSSLGR